MKEKQSTEEKILDAAARLLEEGGVEAVTTRAVCQAAGITAPTLYHHFGDKDGLLGAVVAQGVAAFMAEKRANRQTADALADLKRGWNGWLDFALERPALFRQMIEHTRSNPGASQEAFMLMQAMVERLAQEGRLKTGVGAAAHTIWAASNGILSLFIQGTPVADIRASSELLFDALVARLIKPKK